MTCIGLLASMMTRPEEDIEPLTHMDQFVLAIVEDEQAHFELMKRVIRKEFPFSSIHYFSDASECLLHIEKIRPDAIIVDYVVPGMTGLEFLEELRAKRYKIPVIMITGQGDENIAVKAMKLGAWDYIIKSKDFFNALPRVLARLIRDKSLKDSLEKEEKRFRDLAESTTDWIWEVDVDGRYTYSSPKVERIIGYSPAEIIGAHFFDFFTEEDREAQRRLIFDLMTEGKPITSFCNRIVHKDGHEVSLETSGVPFYDNSGRLAGYRGIDRDITKRTRAEAALRESEQRFRSIYEESPIGIQLYDKNGELVDANEASLEIFGVSDIHIARYCNLLRQPFLPPDTFTRLKEGEVIRFEIPFTFENPSAGREPVTTRSGTIFLNVLLTSFGARDKTLGYLVQVQDVTQRKKTEAILATSHQLLQIANQSTEMESLLKEFAQEIKAFSHCDAVMISVPGDESTSAHTFNIGFPREALSKLDGLIPAETESLTSHNGKGIFQWVQNLSSNARSFYVSDMCRATDSTSSPTRNFCQALRTRFTFRSFAVIPVMSEGAPIGLIVLADEQPDKISMDVVVMLEGAALALGAAIHRLQAHDKLQEAHRELESRVERRTKELALTNRLLMEENEERKKAEKALLTHSEKFEHFAYSILHDLKSPSVGIYGLTRLLQKQYADVLDDRGKSYCEQILKSSEYSSALVEKINMYIASKESPLHIEKVSLREIVHMIHDEFATRLHLQQIRWKGPDVDIELNADRLSLLRALKNFVDNALKYAGEQLSEIEVKYEDHGDFHEISVRDDGSGVKSEASEAIFGLFQRDEDSRDIAGTGLGLAIVREIAERHGGRVWVEPNSPRGASFFFSIAKDLPLTA